LHEIELKRTPDIVDELIYQAMKQGASVEIVSQDMSDFNQVGAFLRFPVQK
jgi:peptide subunit release factor 1 (eRF1)